MEHNFRILVKIKENLHSSPIGTMINFGLFPDETSIPVEWRSATLIERELWYNGITRIPDTKDK